MFPIVSERICHLHTASLVAEPDTCVHPRMMSTPCGKPSLQQEHIGGGPPLFTGTLSIMQF